VCAAACRVLCPPRLPLQRPPGFVSSHSRRAREFPGQLQKIYEWFRDYKIPDGKPANAFGYDNKCMDKDFALKVRTSAA
jgi:hypothetical protein